MCDVAMYTFPFFFSLQRTFFIGTFMLRLTKAESQLRTISIYFALLFLSQVEIIEDMQNCGLTV